MIIIHRCECTHPDFHHGNNGACLMCSCSGGHLLPESEAIPSWETVHPGLGTRLNEDVVPPGTSVKQVGQLCACPSCKQLYQQITAA